MSRRRIAVLALVVSGAIAALVPSAFGARKATQVTICYANKATDFLPLWVANNHGFFTANGLDPNLVLTTGATGSQVLSSGSCQIDMDGIVDLQAIAQGAPFVAFGGDANRFEFVLVARTASNVNNVKDLKGKTLALSSANGAVGIAGLALLKEFGLSNKDVKVVYIPSIAARLAALASGSIDAMIASPPVSSITADGKAKVVYDMKPKFRFILVANWTTRSYAEQHPDVLRAFLRSWIQAVQWMKMPAHKTAVLGDIGSLTGFTDPASLNEAYNYTVPDFDSQPIVNKVALENSLAWVNQQTGKNVTPSQVLYDGPLDQVLTYQLAGSLKGGNAKGSFTATVNRSGTLKWTLHYTGKGTVAAAYVSSGKKPQANPYGGKTLCKPCGSAKSGTLTVSSAVRAGIEQGTGFVSIVTAKPLKTVSATIVAQPGS